MAIKDLGNETYAITVYEGRGPDGKQIRHYATAYGKKEAEKLERKIKYEIEERKLNNIGNMRFKTWADKWLELNEKRLSTSTVVLYRIYIETHYKKYFNNIKLKDINEIHIKDFINTKLKEKYKKPIGNKKFIEVEIKPNTVRKLFFVLNRILEDALKQNNPCRDVEPPKKTKSIPYVPTKEEYEKIYNAFKTDKYKLIISLAGKCGLRRGEIFALKWEDIDKKNKLIIVDEAMAIKTDGTYDEKPPKSNTGIRKVPCPSSILEQIEAYRLKQKEIGKVIFKGRPDNFSSAFSERMKEIGLPDMTFHKLRHYCASWLYEQGIQDHIVAEILGHDIMVLKQIYQHIGVDKKEQVFNQIRALQDN